MATGVTKTAWNGGIEGDEQVHGRGGMSLVYEGKASLQDILATPPSSASIVWTQGSEPSSRLYFGDNLPVLSGLAHDPTVRGKVRLIYIDPPYATNSVFQSRSQVNAYQDLLVGPDYIEFLRRRLVLMRELLADDGSIYMHLDENMAFHMKVIMDEVFGARNFRNWITRKKCNPKNYTRKTYGDISDYILFYTKSDSYVWNRPYDEWTKERSEKEYPCIDERTGRRYKKVPIHAAGVRNGATGQPWRGMNPPPGKHWQFTPSKLDEMEARGEIYWSATGNPRRKIYLDNSEGVPVQDIWLDVRDLYNQNTKITGYPTEKNPNMLARIIGASSNPGDLVLDCFAGSGTTLSIADQMDRRWIGVDNSSEAIRTVLQRFSRGTARMGDFVQDLRSSGLAQDAAPANLSMFDLPEPSAPTDTEDIVTNFAMYADQDTGPEIADIIGQWCARTP